MKTTTLFRYIGFGILSLCCVAGSLSLTSCGDDDKEDTVTLPQALYKQWRASGDGVETNAVIYDLTSSKYLYVLWQPTQQYASKAEMSTEHFYMYAPSSYTADIDVATGTIRLNTSVMGVIKITDLTEGSLKIDGRTFTAATSKVKSAGDWRIVESPLN